MDFFIRPAFQQKFCAMHRGFQPLRFFSSPFLLVPFSFGTLDFYFPNFSRTASRALISLSLRIPETSFASPIPTAISTS